MQFQIARRDKKAFFSNQCKEIEGNNRMGKTRDLFKKMKLEPIIQSEVSQKEKHQYSILTYIYGI